MMDYIAKLSLGMILLAGLALPLSAVAADEATAAAGDDGVAVEEQGKLLKWTTLETAFLKADRDRSLLQQYILQQRAQLDKAEGDDQKKEIQKNVDDAMKKLQTLSIAMDVVFGIGNRRDYEYNPVTSTVYLKVGNVKDAFARTVRTRDILGKYIAKQTELKEQEKDAAKQGEIDQRIQAATRQYQVVVASMQVIFGVTPKRSYTYDPKSSTLYLKITDAEAENLKTQLRKIQDEKAAE